LDDAKITAPTGNKSTVGDPNSHPSPEPAVPASAAFSSDISADVFDQPACITQPSAAAVAFAPTISSTAEAPGFAPKAESVAGLDSVNPSLGESPLQTEPKKCVELVAGIRAGREETAVERGSTSGAAFGAVVYFHEDDGPPAPVAETLSQPASQHPPSPETAITSSRAVVVTRLPPGRPPGRGRAVGGGGGGGGGGAEARPMRRSKLQAADHILALTLQQHGARREPGAPVPWRPGHWPYGCGVQAEACPPVACRPKLGGFLPLQPPASCTRTRAGAAKRMLG
jgi:hypothetical protein